MKPSHIFIVGVGRSGTKFLMNVLNNHSEIDICPETHFFSKLLHNGVLKEAGKIGDMKRDENVAKLVDSLYSGKVFGTYWKDPLPKNKERLLELFKATDRTPRSLFEALINEHKDSNQKKIAGEKTPSHLYHIPELLEWFPQAKIIHIIRDPRAVLSSEINKDAKPDYPIKKRGFLYNTGLFIYVWLQWMSAFRLDEKN